MSGRSEFVDVLIHLQGLIGRPVRVGICPVDHEPVAVLEGGLGGDAREQLDGPFPDGAAVFVLGFVDGADDGHISGFFVLDPAKFEGAAVAEDGALAVKQQGLAITVMEVQSWT